MTTPLLVHTNTEQHVHDLSTGRVSRAIHFVRERGVSEVFRLLREHGVGGAINFVVRNIRHMVADRIARDWDRKHRVDTAGSIQLASLDVVGPNRNFGNEAVCTSPSTFDFIMTSLPRDLSDYTFIDIGAGKSRTLLLASRYPFSKVMGVEFARELVEISKRNIENFECHDQKCRDLEITQCDAAQFDFPNKRLVVFFYNPFSREVFDVVIRNLAASLKKHQRDCYVIYGSSSHNAINWAQPAILETEVFDEIGTPAAPFFWDAVRTVTFSVFRAK